MTAQRSVPEITKESYEGNLSEDELLDRRNQQRQHQQYHQQRQHRPGQAQRMDQQQGQQGQQQQYYQGNLYNQDVNLEL